MNFIIDPFYPVLPDQFHPVSKMYTGN